MKKVTYIFILGLGLVAASCQKQDIVPNSNGAMDVPVWEDGSNERTGDGSTVGTDDDGVQYGATGEGEEPGHAGGFDDTWTGTGITDPNKPSEGSSGKGKK